jgi:hypothetical protein
MQILPADPAAIALPFAIPADAVTYAIEPAKLFDADVDDLAGPLAF